MIDLKKFAGKRYRVVVEQSYESGADDFGKLWYYEIPAKYGRIYVHGENTLGVFVKGAIKINRMAKMAGLKSHQRGDDEATFLFDPAMLDTVAEAMKARKRSVYSEAYRAELSARASALAAKINADRESNPGAPSHA